MSWSDLHSSQNGSSLPPDGDALSDGAGWAAVPRAASPQPLNRADSKGKGKGKASDTDGLDGFGITETPPFRRPPKGWDTQASEEGGTSADGHSTTKAGSVASAHLNGRSSLPSTPVRSPPHSNAGTDILPRVITPSHSISESLASAAFPRRPLRHPQISRLRSTSAQLSRQPSTSSQPLPFLDPTREDNGPNGFDYGSRRSSVTNIRRPAPSVSASEIPLSEPGSPKLGSVAGDQEKQSAARPTFKWSSLKRVAAKVIPSAERVDDPSSPGSPTCMAVNGCIVVGTTRGWVLVFDFGQNLKCICGTEAIVKEAGPVTALAISQDQTFIAVGHEQGFIHIYALVKPTQPARSVAPTTLQLVLSGRKEGHLEGSRILRLGFVGARHTAIVSSDETGLAFYHSLGKMLMLASNDIIRMLGRYPDPNTPPGTRTASASSSPALGSTTPRGKKPSVVLDMAPLPLGPASHLSDAHSLVALLTPTKLVIVGLKPTPRTWWRATFAGFGGHSRSGVLTWFPCVQEEGKAAEDPKLAFAWGRSVRLVRVHVDAPPATNGNGTLSPAAANGIMPLSFTEEPAIETQAAVLGLQWYSQHVLFVVSVGSIEVYDARTWLRLGSEAINTQALVTQSYLAPAFEELPSSTDLLAYSASFRTFKRKVFLLEKVDVRASALLSWADRLLTLMQSSTILQAIEETTSYYLGFSDSSTISLPDDLVARQDVIRPKLQEILLASLDFVFSEDRLRDGTHSDGATIQSLFEGLVSTCVRACTALDDIDFLFDDLYERYEQNGIETIFLDQIEPFVLSGSVHAVSPSVSQRLIAIRASRKEYEEAERIILNVDPQKLDLNQALSLSKAHALFDALVYVYNRAMTDYVSPLVELLGLVRRIQQHRKERPRRVGDEEMGGNDESEALVPNAYKVYAYLSQALTGLSFPSRKPLPANDAISARNAIYSFLFSGRTVVHPARGGRAVLTSNDDGGNEPTYPYLRLLLQFDSEALLDALDLAFEESYLDDSIAGKPVNRQLIVSLLLEVISDSQAEFSPVDRTFVYIFVARNLPKYPQFIELRPSILWDVLVELATDRDQSTTEDRQLATEYLLSTYTPRDSEAAARMFEEAGFFRILRSIYKAERKWASLASTYLRDEDVGGDVFALLRRTLRLAKTSSKEDKEELAQTIVGSALTLFRSHEDGMQHTADLVDEYLPAYHQAVLAQLEDAPWRQFAYLRYLLEPHTIEAASDAPASNLKERGSSANLDTPQRLQYLSLLCVHDPHHVVRYLEEYPSLAHEEDVLRICEERGAFDALIWATDARGDVKGALDRVDEFLEGRADVLVRTLLSSTADEDEDGQAHPEEQVEQLVGQIAAIATASIDLCVRRTTQRLNGAKETVSGEELWFRLLYALVSTTRSIKAVTASDEDGQRDTRSSRRRVSGASIIIRDDAVPLSARASDALEALLPTALSALVSNTSAKTVSFPNLMRRLIESNARSPASQRSYAQFKGIVSSMLDSYAFEGEMLALASQTIRQDLYANTLELKLQRDRGWRSGQERCAECCQPVWGPEGQGSPPMSRSQSVSEVVQSLGLGGRPRMKKRPSLKGKEIEWPPAGDVFTSAPEQEAPREIVVVRDGRTFHQSCFLMSTLAPRPY